MRSTSFTVGAPTRLLALVMMSSVAGCQTIPATPIAAIEQQLAADTCKAWLPVTYSSHDTEQTKTEAKANNAARDGYCKYTQPKE